MMFRFTETGSEAQISEDEGPLGGTDTTDLEDTNVRGIP